MTTPTYEVQVESSADGPPPELVERFARIAAFRLGRLHENEGHYPVAGGTFDMLDNLEGPYLWERSDEELAEDPPTRVDFEVLAVDPVERPTDGSAVAVRVRVLF